MNFLHVQVLDNPDDDDLLLALALPKREKRAVYRHVNPFHMPPQKFATLFYFQKDDLVRMCEALRLPDVYRTSHGTTCVGSIALCYLLFRYKQSLSMRAAAAILHVSHGFLSEIVKVVERDLFLRFARHLEDFHPTLVCRRTISRYSRKMREYGNPMRNVWAVIDGTKFPICKPGGPDILQRVNWSGKDQIHALSYQAVVAPDGMFVNFYGGIEGRHNDLTLLQMSRLEEKMEAHPGKSSDLSSA